MINEFQFDFECVSRRIVAEHGLPIRIAAVFQLLQHIGFDTSSV